MVCFTGLLLGVNSLTAQRVADHKIWQSVANGKFHAARLMIEKALRKDSTRSEYWYALARWYATPQNPDFDVDSASRFLSMAKSGFIAAQPKERERFRKFSLDSARLAQLASDIDSLAFEEAKKVHTAGAYEHFVRHFPTARQQAEAYELEQEVSFLDALKTNTPESFHAFFLRYPKAARAREAQARYDRLLFQRATEGGTLAEYEQFSKDHPTSPFRPWADQKLFEAWTASGTPEVFDRFIQQHPSNHFWPRAVRILAFLTDSLTHVGTPWADSLAVLMRLQDEPWIPFRKNGFFGFMNTAGQERLPARFRGMEETYRCGDVTDIFLKTADGLVDRYGRVVTDSVADVVDVGMGFVKVGKPGHYQLFHKSGYWLLTDHVEEVKPIFRQFLAVRQEGGWALMALNGRVLTHGWDDIASASSLLVFTRLGKKTVCRVDDVIGSRNNALSRAMVFDEVKTVRSNRLLVMNGALEGLLDDSLRFVVPLERQVIALNPFGIIVRHEQRITLTEVSPTVDGKTWQRVHHRGKWLVLQNHEGTRLYDLVLHQFLPGLSDSLRWEGDVPLVHRADSLLMAFSARQAVRLSATERIVFLRSDPVRYFYTVAKGRCTVHDFTTGQRLFSMVADDIEYAGHGLFLVTVRKKKGLVTEAGRWRLPAEHDAIVRTREGYFSLLKNGKFGAFDPVSQALLPVRFDRNPQPLTAHTWLAYEAGFFGFVDRTGKPLGAFEYGEVVPLSPDRCWVKRQGQWQLLNLQTGMPLVDRIKRFQRLAAAKDETYWLIARDNYVGVAASRSGLLIPCSFTDIKNVGSSDQPVFFTEKYIEEADIFIVIYYDRQGSFLRKQVYEKDEYEQLYCEE